MKFLICMPTGKDGIQDDAVIRNALLTAVNRITLMDEKSGEFEAGVCQCVELGGRRIIKIKKEDKMAQCTREQVDRWNAKLSNGFRLDLERFIIWNDKVATRSIELPDGKVLKADIGWTEVREEPRLGCFYQKTIGMMPRLSLSLWTPSSTPGMWCSRGLGAVVKITNNIYQKRNWNELAKFTAEWDEKRLLEEAKKHMAELQNDVVA